MAAVGMGRRGWPRPGPTADHPSSPGSERSDSGGGCGHNGVMSTSDLFALDGKVAVVTGGTSGIGRMIADGLVDAGMRVYVASRQADACARVAGELSERGTCVGLPADLSTQDGCRALAAGVAEREAAVDLLVNNAGATWGAPLEEYPDAAFDKLWAVNVKGVFHLTVALRHKLDSVKRKPGPLDLIVRRATLQASGYHRQWRVRWRIQVEMEPPRFRDLG